MNFSTLTSRSLPHDDIMIICYENPGGGKKVHISVQDLSERRTADIQRKKSADQELVK